MSKIAENGHVLHYTTTVQDLNKNGGKLSVKKVGIKDASAFYGFCGKHDRELFSCIENEPFTGRPDQCLAVAYRTISRELYGKDAAAHLRETLRGADKGMRPFEQFMFQKMLDDIDTGNEAARREAKVTHDELTSALVNNRPETIASYVFDFEAPLPFMFAGAWSPFTDLYGDELQNGYFKEILQQIIVSSFAEDKRAKVCISWRDIDGAPGKVIAEQIKALPADQQASALLQIVTKHVENIFFHPIWYRGLGEKQKEHLKRLATDGVDIMGSVPSSPIRLEIDFQLPLGSRSFRP
ncbi:MAG: hypothetical protein ABJG14_12515 [Sulfitobacter sp.]|uniref:hypothetical protein n=1 Tax=Alphaproteobacteria TaxID=28211 RepID=UPI00326731F6